MLGFYRKQFSPMWAIAPVTLVLVFASGMLLARRLRRCQHRFGMPVSGHVRCMKCYQRFRIEANLSGEWRIARRPEKEIAAGPRF